MAKQLYRHEEDESIRRLNLEKKDMTCLGCYATIHTDRCHRYCESCNRRIRRNRGGLNDVVGDGDLDRLISLEEVNISELRVVRKF